MLCQSHFYKKSTQLDDTKVEGVQYSHIQKHSWKEGFSRRTNYYRSDINYPVTVKLWIDYQYE